MARERFTTYADAGHFLVDQGRKCRIDEFVKSLDANERILAVLCAILDEVTPHTTDTSLHELRFDARQDELWRRMRSEHGDPPADLENSLCDIFDRRYDSICRLHSDPSTIDMGIEMPDDFFKSPWNYESEEMKAIAKAYFSHRI